MEASFWHERWAKKEIAFHEGAPNRLLVTHIDALNLGAGARIFLPLCGKTVDIGWLLGRGTRVAGIDLSPIAVRELFDALGVRPTIETVGDLERYSANDIDIFVGDIFSLDAETLGAVDAVYDRAAIVALPQGMRASYAAHLASLTRSAPQLCLTFEYDPALFDGPPFSVPAEEIERCHGTHYRPRLLERGRVPGGLKRHDAVDEAAWFLEPRTAES